MNDLPLSVDGGGELIAALPALLGFYPENSLVLITLCPLPNRSADLSIGLVLHRDLDPCLNPRSAHIDAAARICADNHAEHVAVITIDPHLQSPGAVDTTPRGTARRQMLLLLRTALAAKGIALAGAWAITAVQAQQPWWSLLDGEHGLLADPATSPLTAATVLATGHRIYRSHTELTSTVQPDTELVRLVRSHLPDAAEAARRRARKVTSQDPQSGLREAIESILEHVDSVDQLTPAGLAEVAVALKNSTVRDCLLGLAATSSAPSAHRLWLALTRAFPAPERAQPAVLLAVSAYLDRNVPLANLAVEVALKSDPLHRLARMVDTAFRIGLPPERFLALARQGVGIATELGIEFPQPTTPE